MVGHVRVRGRSVRANPQGASQSPASVRESSLAWTPRSQRTGINPACYAYEVRSSGLIGFANFVGVAQTFTSGR